MSTVETRQDGLEHLDGLQHEPQDSDGDLQAVRFSAVAAAFLRLASSVAAILNLVAVYSGFGGRAGWLAIRDN